jgi:hypothetical protein
MRLPEFAFCKTPRCVTLINGVNGLLIGATWFAAEITSSPQGHRVHDWESVGGKSLEGAFRRFVCPPRKGAAVCAAAPRRL